MRIPAAVLALSLLIVSSAAAAQAPCGTTIQMDGVPSEALCNKLTTQRLYATPPGGTWSGEIVSATGHLSADWKPSGTYYAVYTAPDSCATRDSVAIEVLAVHSHVFFDGSFDCATDQGGSFFARRGTGETLSIHQRDTSWFYASYTNNDPRVELTNADELYVSVFAGTDHCGYTLDVATNNNPRISAYVDYNCADNVQSLAYTGQQGDYNVLWQRYRQTPGDLGTRVAIGHRIPHPEPGRYLLMASYDNGCTSRSQTEVLLDFPIVPGVNAGVYGAIPCYRDAADTCRLLGNLVGPYVEHAWSMPDASPFPGDSTAQRPFVPCEPTVYNLRTYNTVSGCYSELDQAVLRKQQPDTTSLSVALCAGESYQAGGRAFAVSGTYVYTVRDAQDCDSTVVLDLLVADPITGDLSYGDPDSDGRYEVTAQVRGGLEPYAYAWSDGSADASRTGLPAGTYELTVTDALGCRGVFDLVLPQVSGLTAKLPGRLSVAPNPVRDRLTWRCSGDAALAGVLVLDPLGREVLRGEVASGELDFAHLPPGVYVVRWTDAAGRSASRTVVRQ